jgi:hypothetical protein
MSEAAPPGDGLWYVRRNAAVRGPFPAAQIGRYLLLGRIRETDELSQDQVSWRPLSELPELIPEAVRNGADPETLDRLRRREDERGGTDRRADEGPVPAAIRERRSGKDRRAPEAAKAIARQAAKSRLIQEGRRRHENYRPLWIGTVLALVLIFTLGVWLVPAPDDDVPDCEAPPRPQVNWNNCRLEDLSAVRQDLSGAKVRNAKLRQANLFGARLTEADLAYSDLVKANLSYANLRGATLKGTNLLGADLAYADLSDADLSYADLSSAVLGGAALSGTQLDNAVWIDGSLCAPGSVGQCLPMAVQSR